MLQLQLWLWVEGTVGAVASGEGSKVSEGQGRARQRWGGTDDAVQSFHTDLS